MLTGMVFQKAKGRCLLFHKWSEWKVYQEPILVKLAGQIRPSTETRQARKCERCGKVDDEYLY